MNKILSIAAIVALATTLSFSQEEGVKFGIRAGFNLVDFSSEDKEIDRYLDMGYGFGGGLAINIPIASSLSLAPEVSLLYRRLYTAEIALYDAQEWVTEFAISIPVMLQFMPVEGVPFYLAAGVQLDIPIASEITTKLSGTEVTEDLVGRTSTDFGIPLGLGYLITPNFGVDFRAVIGITGPSERVDNTSFNQYGLGATYFF